MTGAIVNEDEDDNVMGKIPDHNEAFVGNHDRHMHTTRTGRSHPLVCLVSEQISCLPGQLSPSPCIPIASIYRLAHHVRPYPHHPLLLLAHPDPLDTFPFLANIKALFLLCPRWIIFRLSS